MKTLVAYASKHGSTQEIAEVISGELELQGRLVDIRAVSTVDSIDGYDFVVLGSAIYMGQWQKSALEFVDRFHGELQSKPVWLFSSGPIGKDPFPKDDPPITPELIEKTGAIEHRSFAGRLDRSKLGIGERVVSAVVRAPEGDFRDWDDIRGWAREVAKAHETQLAVATESAG